MVSLTFLEKSSYLNREISTFSLILFLKIEKFYRIKELFKVNQIDIPDYQYHLDCKTKRMAGLAFLEEKVRFSIGNPDFFCLIYF